jgi:hypothetical protein
MIPGTSLSVYKAFDPAGKPKVTTRTMSRVIEAVSNGWTITCLYFMNGSQHV